MNDEHQDDHGHYFAVAEGIARAHALRLTHAPLSGLDEAFFNGMLWMALAAVVAPEWVQALERDLMVGGGPTVRLPGTSPTATPEEVVQREIEAAERIMRAIEARNARRAMTDAPPA